jgi:hypothetical protein
MLPRNRKAVTSWKDCNAAFLEIANNIREAIKEMYISPSSQPSATTSISLLGFGTTGSIELTIQPGDIALYDADVVALKFAQDFYGADELVASLFSKAGISIDHIRPPIGEYSYIETRGSIKAHHALFIGVPELNNFDYLQIRQFAARALNILAHQAPRTRHLAMTIHGINYGLDEIEAVNAQLAGYLDSLQSGQLPPMLETITIVDINQDRVQRLRESLQRSLANASYASRIGMRWAYRLTAPPANNTLNRTFNDTKIIERAGIESAAKAHAFVAIPFTKEMDDVFYYGIQQPVRDAGFVCERVDQEAFTGDILDRVKKKIETAAVVIAELSGANPNVYLEVGYAWGKGRPTILLVKGEQDLRFDVRGQRCLKYERIKDLEDALHKELRSLNDSGFV